MNYAKHSREENESLFLNNTGYEGCLWKEMANSAGSIMLSWPGAVWETSFARCAGLR